VGFFRNVTRFPRDLAPAIATVLLLAALPSTAGAATVSMRSPGSTPAVEYYAGAGEENRLTVTESDTAIVFEDAGALITPSPPCVQDGPSRASCPLPPPGSQLGVGMGGGDDTVTLRLHAGGRFNATDVHGGPGNDVLTGSDIDDIIGGDAGNDTINPGPGRDLVRGDEGDDTIDTRDAPPDADPYDQAYNPAYEDSVSCGDGIDTLKADYLEYLAAGGGRTGDCENVETAGPPVEGGGGGGGPGPAPGSNNPLQPPLPLGLANRVAKARGKTAKLSMRCPAQSASACDGSVQLAYRGKVVGQTARFSVQPGKTAVAAVKLSAVGRKLSGRRGGAKVSVVAVPNGGSPKSIGSVKLLTR
jgi:hypothetical protein